MRLKLTKGGKIIIGLFGVVLLSSTGYLIWRTNQPEPLASTDSEAAEGLCDDADYVLDVKKVVCGAGCFKGSPASLCPSQQTFSITVPTKGEFTVKGIVGRGHCDANGKNCQCQNKEEFYISIGGKKGLTAKDDYTGKTNCGVTTIVQDLGKFDLEAQAYSVKMISAAPTCAKKGDYPANSVNLNTICLYSTQECGDGVLQGNEQCESNDPSGVKCSWTSCDQSKCECLPAGLSIVKSVKESCIGSSTNSPVSVLAYTVKVTNTGEGIGMVSKIEDTLDAKISSANLTPVSITSPGTYSSGVILWSFPTPLTIGPNQSKIFTYKINVDKNNFGTYNNTVTLTPVEGDTLDSSVTITADCEISEPSVPQTGILDNTFGRIATGIALLILGLVVYNFPSGRLLIIDNVPNYKYRDRFENNISKKISKE